MNFDERVFYGIKSDEDIYGQIPAVKSALHRIRQMQLPEIGTIKGITKYSGSQIISKARKASQELFSGINLQVKIVSPKDIVILQRLLQSGKTEEAFSVARQARETSVFNIPCEFDIDTTSMEAFEQRIALRSPKTGYAPDGIKPLLLKIKLSKNTDVLTGGIYIHELVHALLERYRGSIQNTCNLEVISMFFEKYITEKIGSPRDLKAIEIYRLASINLNNGESSALKHYLYGPLVSGVLFDKFQKSDKEEKIKILNGIKNLLRGNGTVEDFLKEQEIVLDEESLTSYIDKVERYVKDVSPQAPNTVKKHQNR